jgi:hypothetical protein
VPEESGKVIGCRYPLAVEAQLAAMPPAERLAFIQRWVDYELRLRSSRQMYRHP